MFTCLSIIIFDKKEETDQTLLHVYFFKLCFLLICTVFYSSPDPMIWTLRIPKNISFEISLNPIELAIAEKPIFKV